MEEGKSFWLPFLTHFRGGSMITDAIQEQEQFIRYPAIVAEGADFADMPQYIGDGKGALAQLSPLWDYIIVDKATRKILPITVVASLPELKESFGGGIDTAAAHEIKNYYPEANLDAWQEVYGGIGAKVLFTQYVNDPRHQCLERGWRCELIVLGLTENPLSENPLTEKDWFDFQKNCVTELTGRENGILHRTFFAELPLL